MASMRCAILLSIAGFVSCSKFVELHILSAPDCCYCYQTMLSINKFSCLNSDRFLAQASAGMTPIDADVSALFFSCFMHAKVVQREHPDSQGHMQQGAVAAVKQCCQSIAVLGSIMQNMQLACKWHLLLLLQRLK